jgi:hypothetical protein
MGGRIEQIVRFVFLGLTLALAQLAQAGQRGVINDPDGYVNLREGKSVEAAVIATAKTGEPFIFERAEGDEWCKVTLAGQIGLDPLQPHPSPFHREGFAT